MIRLVGVCRFDCRKQRHTPFGFDWIRTTGSCEGTNIGSVVLAGRKATSLFESICSLPWCQKKSITTGRVSLERRMKMEDVGMRPLSAKFMSAKESVSK